MNNQKKNLLSILAILLTIIIAVSAMYVSYRLGSGQLLAPTAPESEPAACDAQCPSSSDPSLLVSCTPTADGSFNSTCNATGRVESCGGQNYCCPSPGGTWTTNMSACPTATTTVAPTATTAPTATVGQVSECSPCTSSGQCASGLSCDTTDGRCKKTDGTSVCFETAAACTASATSICVPTEVKTCNPDCSSACGQTAKIINTCTDSCGFATTKQCNATNACANALTITKTAYRNETSNVPGNYQYQNVITTVARNQVFLYEIRVQNTSEVDANDITITDVLDGENQGLLTFVDAHSNCSYNSANRRVTCTGLDVDSGEQGRVAFRVRVGSNAVNGEEISNTATGSISGGTATATNTLTISTVVACNQICTQDSECTTGLYCDTGEDRCRRAACSTETDCTCPVTATTTPTGTTAPTSTVTPTATLTAGATTGTPTIVLPTTDEQQAEVLPETGILDFPGIAAFGGGLLLAVIGILLAL